MVIIRRSLGHLVRRVSDRLWQINFFLPATVNCWLWSETDGLTLIDAAQPWNVDAILRAIDETGQPLARIIVTHAHPDHAGAAAELQRRTGAPVYAHENEIPFLTGCRCMADEDGYWLCRALLKTGQHLRLINPPAIEKVLAVADNSNVGGLQILHTPGHTPGSISLWAEDDCALFCGDNVSNTLSVLRLNFSHFTLDFAGLHKSISRYSELPARLLLPGHGPPYRSDDAIKDVQRLLPSVV